MRPITLSIWSSSWSNSTRRADLGLLTEPILPRDGFISPSEAPGHGVRFDRSMLARYKVED